MNYNTYLSQDEIVNIQQRIIDLYGDEYLTSDEYFELFNQMADTYLHDDDLYINNI
ncbi:hypothetical protein H2493_002472 [Staphylococcus pseudintermedius]|uniref:hypothetical protein n=1 Tax=Staphylococcus pseudintermedius TaxID=283734 RepID=UPI0018F38E72|nr:hypothetical protein [Staphylococcus pseudintermedius]EGQ3068526.1 hypothetical protein [Staphylococcus pseudintermedius]EGQ3151759.1 hypothetical protein [Staphylococcus pseudintermedius]EHT6215614.1 hypothetical protein [Staphylococcus pseudintermedius]EIM5219212.1 hypothetical protein [Staphylococcus pseudintermedius]EJH4195358.1 hypothetical protein [Staphylococcus pseudintermedius]